MFLADFLSPVSKNTKTSKKNLQKIDHPFAVKLLKFKETSLLISSAESIRRHIDGSRVYTNMSQIGSITGRIYCKEPNLQGMAQELRKLCSARPGYKIITADYSQKELRILASISKDRALRKILKNDEDLFATIAAKLFTTQNVSDKQRKAAKAAVYGILYGMPPISLARELNVTKQEANSFYESFFKSFPGVNKKFAELSKLAKNNGYSETLIGRKNYYKPDALSKAVRLARNHHIQGIASDIFKKALYFLGKKMTPFNTKIVMVVHDEIVVECHKSDVEMLTRHIEKYMIKAAKHYLKAVPIKVSIEVNDTWK